MKQYEIFFVALLVILGLVYRLYGISQNHSFWLDEAHVANAARDIIAKGNLIDVLSRDGIIYQPLHVLSIAFSFYLFGVSEYSARLPSIIFGSIGIFFAYLYAKRLSNVYGALISSFMMTFSQLNLSNSTQAKPYTAIQSLSLISFYLVNELNNTKTKRLNIHLLIILINTLSSTFNYIGILIWIPYLYYLSLNYGSTIFLKIKKPKIFILFSFLIVFLIFLFQIPQMLRIFLTPENNSIFLSYNNTTYLREILWKNYAFIFLPSIVGFMFVFLKNKRNVVGILMWIFVLIYLWNFRTYSHNIRYLVPFFGLIFVFFGIFWGLVIEKFFIKYEKIFIILLIVMLFLGGNKIVRKPSVYYSPNEDIFADVQNADYKNIFEYLNKNMNLGDNVAIINNNIEGQQFYLPKRPNATAYFVKHVKENEPQVNPINGVAMWYSVKNFQDVQKKYPKGIVIIEDWQSKLPDEVKDYVKKNLKLEFKKDSLDISPSDKWPIEIYTWGK